jgi:hypothetical protein
VFIHINLFGSCFVKNRLLSTFDIFS